MFDCAGNPNRSVQHSLSPTSSPREVHFIRWESGFFSPQASPESPARSLKLGTSSPARQPRK